MENAIDEFNWSQEEKDSINDIKIKYSKYHPVFQKFINEDNAFIWHATVSDCEGAVDSKNSNMNNGSFTSSGKSTMEALIKAMRLYKQIHNIS